MNPQITNSHQNYPIICTFLDLHWGMLYEHIWLLSFDDCSEKMDFQFWPLSVITLSRDHDLDWWQLRTVDCWLFIDLSFFICAWLAFLAECRYDKDYLISTFLLNCWNIQLMDQGQIVSDSFYDFCIWYTRHCIDLMPYKPLLTWYLYIEN